MGDGINTVYLTPLEDSMVYGKLRDRQYSLSPSNPGRVNILWKDSRLAGSGLQNAPPIIGGLVLSRFAFCHFPRSLPPRSSEIHQPKTRVVNLQHHPITHRTDTTHVRHCE